jgi:hypothetical protein
MRCLSIPSSDPERDRDRDLEHRRFRGLSSSYLWLRRGDHDAERILEGVGRSRSRRLSLYPYVYPSLLLAGGANSPGCFPPSVLATN